MASVTFAYNTTNSIPASGDSKRVTYSIVWVRDDLTEVVGPEHELGDESAIQHITGKRLKMRFRIGQALLRTGSNQTWFKSFFNAKYRWAVSGDFKDTANSSNANLCKANLVDRNVEVSVDYDLENGYELISEKVF